MFDLPYNVESCNALLYACLRARNLQVGAAMSVLSEMERLGVSPSCIQAVGVGVVEVVPVEVVVVGKEERARVLVE